MKLGSLCSGYEGLGMGIEAVFPDIELAWVSDIDKGANKILAHRFPGVPNLGDFTTLDWSTVEPVDVLTAGFPCQPVSHAGKRLGDDDERWLWDDVARAVRTLRPRLVVLENVRGLLTARGGRLFGRVLGSLADLGYDASWHGLRAADVGAPHGRWRVFIVASPSDARGIGGHQALEHDGRGTAPADWRGVPDEPDRDALRAGPERGLTLLPTPTVDDARGGGSVASVEAGYQDKLHLAAKRSREWGDYTPAIARWEHVLGRPAPAPTMTSAKGNPQLSPAFVEWMMGLPAGWVTDVPGITRNEALKALGNGVVPDQAAAALRILLGGEGLPATGAATLLPTPRSLDATGVRGVTPNRSDESNYRAGATLTDFAMGSIQRGGEGRHEQILWWQNEQGVPDDYVPPYLNTDYDDVFDCPECCCPWDDHDAGGFCAGPCGGAKCNGRQYL